MSCDINGDLDAETSLLKHLNPWNYLTSIRKENYFLAIRESEPIELGCQYDDDEYIWVKVAKHDQIRDRARYSPECQFHASK